MTKAAQAETFHRLTIAAMIGSLMDRWPRRLSGSSGIEAGDRVVS